MIKIENIIIKNTIIKIIEIIVLIIAFCHITACSILHSNSQAEQNRTKKIAEINIQLGMGYLGQGDVKRAKQKLLSALENAPNLPEAWYSMAYFLESTGNQVQAQQYYSKAVDLAPNRGDTQNNYGTFLCRIGKYQDAIKHFIISAQDPQYLDTAGAYENAGLCALKIPDSKSAKMYFTKALEEDPGRTTSITELNKLKY